MILLKIISRVLPIINNKQGLDTATQRKTKNFYFFEEKKNKTLNQEDNYLVTDTIKTILSVLFFLRVLTKTKSEHKSIKNLFRVKTTHLLLML